MIFINKYNAKKVVNRYGTFDSQKEWQRYLVLLDEAKKGKISELERQVKFELFPKQIGSDGKVKERAWNYIADFAYRDGLGHLVVEDVKGYRGGSAYEIFKAKRKAMLYLHGITVKEV